MSFFYEYEKFKEIDILHLISSTPKRAVEKALEQDRLSIEDFATLLSPSALPYLEFMAQKSRDIKMRYFGNTINLFTPIYISNFCNNGCLYCGFNHGVDIARDKLSLDQIRQEAETISSTGLKHILVLTGDAPQIASVEYIAECCKILKDYFSSISIEVFALTEDEYRFLVESGVDGLTIYQETYNQELYKVLHPKGPKRSYRFRLDAPERGASAGMRNVNLGALLGLDLWQRDIFFTALHAKWLEEKYPETDFNISLPRMRPHSGTYQPACIVSDKDMVQMITALRIFLPRCGITISTRESESFRNNILTLGVTKVSAGSTTAVGGHTSPERTGQFEISDTRSVAQMIDYLTQRQIQPVFKDWERF